MLQQWHCRLKKDVSWQEEHSNQRQRSFCAFYRKFRIFYKKLTKKPNWSPKRTWRLGKCPWGLPTSMFPFLTPFPSFFHVIKLLSSKLCFLQDALYFYRKHPVEPLDEPNSISKMNLMVGIYWLGLQALVCPSLAFIHHFFHLLVPLIVLLQDLPVEIVGN